MEGMDRQDKQVFHFHIHKAHKLDIHHKHLLQYHLDKLEMQVLEYILDRCLNLCMKNYNCLCKFESSLHLHILTILYNFQH